MSPSTRSKPASASSPATGAATEDGKPAQRDQDTEPASGDTVEIELEVSRQRTAGWTVFGIVVGLLLVWKLGTVAVWGGFVLIAIGLYRGFQLVQSYRYPAGTIAVSPEQVKLPRGLHMAQPLAVMPSEITAVYFLRRSVPWNRHAPVLVIELGARALAFPRDWFATEADQRRIVHALLAHCPALGEAAAKAHGRA